MAYRCIPHLHLAVLVSAALVPCRAQFPESLWVHVTYYDYHADGSNPNFEPSAYDESDAGLQTGMVRDTLSAERKPLLRVNRVYNDRLNDWFRPSGTGGTGATFSIDPFDGRGWWSEMLNYLGRVDEWVGANYSSSYSMRCVVLYDSLPFHLTDIRTGMFRYDSPLFLPVDGRGYGTEPGYYPPYDWHNPGYQNFSFSMELHRDFVHRNGLVFEFTGDDDVWGFIDGRLVMDLGGIHGPLNRSVSLDTLGLTPTHVYHFDFFFCERHVNHSQLTLSANFLLSPYTIIGLIAHESPTWDSTPCLQWHPGEFSVSYAIQVSRSPAFSLNVVSTTSPDTSITTSVLSPGEYFWRVRAQNASWSETGRFVVLDPHVPMLVPLLPDTTTTRLPVLTWREPPAPAAVYELQVSLSADFSAWTSDTLVGDTTAAWHETLPYGPVYWRVRTEGHPQWSAADTFVVVPDTVPRLVAYEGDTVADPHPPLAWHPVFEADSYQVEIANNNRFHRSTVVRTADTVWVPDSLLSGVPWYWRVSSSRDYRVYSRIDSFVVETQVRVAGKTNAAGGPRVVATVGRDGAVRVQATGLHDVPVVVRLVDLGGRCLCSHVVAEGGPGLVLTCDRGCSSNTVVVEIVAAEGTHRLRAVVVRRR